MFDTPVIYGFVSDTLFWNKGLLVDLDKSISSSVGFIDDMTINYFNKIGSINDPREIRLDILGEVPVGKIKMFFDVTKLAETNPIVNLTKDQATVLMNIIEKCYITQNRTEQELNQELLADDYKSLFVADSARRATSYTTIKPSGMSSELRIYDYIEFTIQIDDNKTKFKLWLNVAKFKKDYPLTTIIKVIAPCKEVCLLDPSLLTSDIKTVVESGEYIFTKTNEGTSSADYTGILSYKTRWIVSSQSIPEIRFGVMYQGAKPSSLEAREAIRDYLKSLNIAPESTWETKLPDLYVTAQFFLLPLWGNKIARPNSKYGYIFPAINKYSKIYSEIIRILPAMELQWLEDKTELLSNPFNAILLVSVPDPLNKIDYISLLEFMPTYQAFGPDDINYTYQEYNAKDFSKKLGNIMAILYGDISSTTNAYTINNFYGRRYLSFSSDKVEYHVLYMEDYDINTGS